MSSSASAFAACLEPAPLRTATPDAHPWPGDVVLAGGRASLLVDARLLDAWRGWDAAGDHVVAPSGLVRTARGHGVLLPMCAQRVDAFVEGRARAGAGLAPGEWVTLVVSLLRGVVDEVRQHAGAECEGCWWLTDDGRPVFVHADDGEPIVDATALLLTEAAGGAEAGAGTSVVRLLGDVAAAIEDPERLARGAAALEDRAFAIAAPEPLATTLLPRRGARPGAEAARRDAAERAEDPGLPSWRRIADAADAGIGDVVSRAITAVWRRARAPRRRTSRVGLFAVAAAAAALVAAVGLLWPVGESSSPAPAGSEAGAGSATSPEPAPAPNPAAPDGAESSGAEGDGTGDGESADLVAETERLLASFEACGDDSGCRAALQEQAGELGRSGAAFATRRRLSLLDDLGGLGLVRADDPDGARASQIVVIVRGDESWLLRDIHDVAQQP